MTLLQENYEYSQPANFYGATGIMLKVSADGVAPYLTQIRARSGQKGRGQSNQLRSNLGEIDKTTQVSFITGSNR